MHALIDFCHSLWNLFGAAVQALFEIVQCVWSNSALRQWICDYIAESPLLVYLIAFAIFSLGGGIALTKRDRRQLWRAADTFCNLRDMSRWFRQK